jgi:hypothetical protein
MALVYLGLHKLIVRMTRKPESKLRWFFGVLTEPLTHPVRSLFGAGASHDALLTRSLIFYGLLWLCLVVIGRIVLMAR